MCRARLVRAPGAPGAAPGRCAVRRRIIDCNFCSGRESYVMNCPSLLAPGVQSFTMVLRDQVSNPAPEP
ncbi:hypothetical protein FM103_20105 [Corynebacterium xerosis]|nr:hypothetical protein FM103_20105 [Corynebacterium xerosis]